MRWILLPGLDGTGLLYEPLRSILPPHIVPVIVSYPVDRICSAQDLLDIILAHLPHDEPYILIAESFSGPLALKASTLHARPPAAIVLAASFSECPLPRILIRALGFLGKIFYTRRPPLFLMRRYLFGAASKDVVNLFYKSIATVEPRVFLSRFQVLSEFGKFYAPRSLKSSLLYLQATRDFLVKKHNARIIKNLYPTVTIDKIVSPHLVFQVEPLKSLQAINNFLQ